MKINQVTEKTKITQQSLSHRFCVAPMMDGERIAEFGQRLRCLGWGRVAKVVPAEVPPDTSKGPALAHQPLRANVNDRSPLLGEKRTLTGGWETSAYDPKRT
jgi:hypothetical protein